MAKYHVEAPDGRKVTLEGDTPPTDADLDEIFKSLPAALDKPIGGEQAMLHPDTSRSEPGAGHPYAQLGRGVQDASAKLLLGARQLFGMESPEEANAIRAQLQPQTNLETAGQIAPTAALAAAVPGGPGLAGLATDAAVGGGLSALESGDPVDAGTGALITGAMSGATRGLSKFLPGSIDRNIDKIALDPEQRALLAKQLMERTKAAGTGLGTALGYKAGGTMGAGIGATVGGTAGTAIGDPVSKLLSSGTFNSLSARAKMKVYDVLRSGDSQKILTTLWRLLPGQRSESSGSTDSITAADMLAEAKRRKAANAVLR
jgi:hypothetical protein